MAINRTLDFYTQMGPGDVILAGYFEQNPAPVRREVHHPAGQIERAGKLPATTRPLGFRRDAGDPWGDADAWREAGVLGELGDLRRRGRLAVLRGESNCRQVKTLSLRFFLPLWQQGRPLSQGGRA